MSLKNYLSAALFCFSLLIVSCSGDPKAETAKADDPATGKAIPVEVMVVKQTTIEQNLILTGKIAAIHAVDIVAEVSGKIEKIYRKLGDRVTTSDTLALIDDDIPLSQYRQAKAQALSAENNLKIAQLNLKSDEQLFQSGDISRLQFENSQLAVKSAEANLLMAQANLTMQEKSYRDTRITTPVSGLIAREFIELGLMVNPNTPVYRVVDLSVLKIEVGLAQDMIRRVHIDSRVRVTISALGEREFEGQVKFISPQADEQTGTFNVEIHLRNTPDLQIRAGMTARLDLMLSEKSDQIVIPDHALLSKDGDKAVYKITNGAARLTNVQVSEIIGSQAILSGGLAVGDTIVVVGMKNLGVETRVWIESVQ